jgi:hypothetical protein
MKPDSLLLTHPRDHGVSPPRLEAPTSLLNLISFINLPDSLYMRKEVKGQYILALQEISGGEYGITI